MEKIYCARNNYLTQAAALLWDTHSDIPIKQTICADHKPGRRQVVTTRVGRRGVLTSQRCNNPGRMGGSCRTAGFFTNDLILAPICKCNTIYINKGVVGFILWRALSFLVILVILFTEYGADSIWILLKAEITRSALLHVEWVPFWELASDFPYRIKALAG